MDLTADFRERADALNQAADEVRAAATTVYETKGKTSIVQQLDEMATTLTNLAAQERQRQREFAIAFSESGF